MNGITCGTSRGYKPEVKTSICHDNVQLGRLVFGLVCDMFFETSFMYERENYFGHFIGQHVSVVITANSPVVACYGETGKTPSTERGVNSRHVGSILMSQLCFHLPVCYYLNLHHWQVITYDKPVLIPSMSVTWSLTVQTEAQGALWHEAGTHRV